MNFREFLEEPSKKFGIIDHKGNISYERKSMSPGDIGFTRCNLDGSLRPSFWVIHSKNAEDVLPKLKIWAQNAPQFHDEEVWIGTQNYKMKQLAESRDEALNWVPWYPKWETPQIGDRGVLNVYISSRHISIDESPYHPLLKKALKILVKQKPYVANKPIDFDGWSPGTVSEFIKSREPIHPWNTLPQYMYHGTSYFRWEHIREHGLQPQSESGAEYGAEPMSAPVANQNYIYLTATFGTAVRLYARDVSKKEGEGSHQVVLRINTNGMDHRKLRADEESKKTSWQDSLHHLNTIAYEGSIPPNKIELYKAYNPDTKTWEEPGAWMDPKDWLAQQTIHRTGYTNIPNSTAKYKWAKAAPTWKRP